MLIVFFTFLCLRVVSQPNNCLSQNPTDLLQTGCISFTSQVQVQSTSYNNQIDVAVTAYPVPANDFSGIVSVKSFENMIFKNGIYYLANGRPKTNANNIFTISFSTNGNFTVMSICYLISSRSDIVIGAFIADTTDPQQCLYRGNAKVVASISLSNWKPVEQSQIQFVGVLVSGITASSSTSSLNLTASFVASLGLLSVVFNYESAVSVQLVAVSYFILKSSSLSLVMTKDATLSWTYSLQGAIPTKAVNQAYLSIGIFPDRLVCIGSQCPASCISTPDCSKAKGIALKINFTCLICEPKEEYVSALGKCFCNNLSYKNNDVCISCWDNSLANPQRTDCVCKRPEYYEDPHNKQNCKKKSICLQGAFFDTATEKCVCFFTNAIYDPTQGCSCAANEVLNLATELCECDNTSYILKNSCVKCGRNSVPTLDSSQCLCITGFYFSTIAQQCKRILTCPALASFDSVAEQCQCIYSTQILFPDGCQCAANSVFDNTLKQCVCNSNSYLVNKVYTVCWPNSTPDSTASTCICNPNTYQPKGSSKICQTIPACGLNAAFDSVSQKCVCSIPTMNLNEDGISCSCPTPLTYFTYTKNCVCDTTNHIIVDGNCIECWQYSIINADKTSCVCNNTSYQPPGYKKCLPIPNCPNGAFFNRTAQICQCSHAGETITNGQCACPKNMAVNATGICACGFNTFTDQNGNCVPCWENSMYNAISHTCVCTSSYRSTTPTSSDCIPNTCPSGSSFNITAYRCLCTVSSMVYSDTGCYCVNGKQYSPSTQQCQCLPPNYQSKDTCTPCWENSIVNSKGDGCVCIGNYYSDTPSSCAQIPHCQAGASFDISLKACACTVALMHLTPTGCVCPSNMVLDTVSNTCTCDSASYFTSATTCTNCWPNAVSTADRRTCKCSLGYYSVAAFVCKALLTQPSIFEPCAPLPSDQIQTGSYIFTRPTRPACTTVPITFTATGTSINFALSINSFSRLSASAQKLYYFVSGTLVSTSLKITLFTAEGWTQVQVSYIISARQEINMGSYIIDTSETYACLQTTGSNKVNSSFLVPRWSSVPTLSVQGVYVFLGGIKSLNDSVSLNYISSFDSVKGIVSINISFGQAHVAVEYVKVFYVIILTAPFGSSLISGLSTLGDYAFSAANGMTNGNCNIVTVSIDMQHYSCLSPSCPYQCLFKSACLDDGGTIVGKNCIICSKDQLFNHNTQTCGCPNNFYQFGDSCKPCWANSKSSLDSTTCVCLTGFTQTGESCV